MQRFLKKIPTLISSNIAIFIYILLFCYLVLFPILCYLIPQLSALMPSNNMQLILGNYTNVLSALGASIAAGAGYKIHKKVTDQQQKHHELTQSVKELHQKIDKLLAKKEQ